MIRLAFTEEEKTQIIAKIQEKTKGQIGICPICKNPNWTLNDGFIPLSLQENIRGLVLGGPILPCVSITCTNCGNTMLLNLITLGLRSLVEKEKKEGEGIQEVGK